MAKTIQVASVGPALCVQGGISTVIELISGHLPAHVSLQLIATFNRFTGDKGATPSERGSRLAQLCVYVVAVVKVLALALGRRTVFHVHFAGRGSLIRKGLICVLLRSFRCQYAVHSHAADTNLFPSWVPTVCRRLILWGLSGAARVIVLTQFWREYYESILNISAERILLLPNPADLPVSIPDRSARQQIRFLFLGRIGVRKGTFDLIHAFADLPEEVRERSSLILAGDGDLQEARTLSERLGCSSRVSMPGWVGAADVATLLADSDVLVLPSYAEGMAMALIEGMSWGLPVVTTSVCGAGEFLEHGSNCILVTPGNVQQISEALSTLVQVPALRHRLGTAARETMSRFSIDSYMVRLYHVYEILADGLPDNPSTVVAAPQT